MLGIQGCQIAHVNDSVQLGNSAIYILFIGAGLRDIVPERAEGATD